MPLKSLFYARELKNDSKKLLALILYAEYIFTSNVQFSINGEQK